MADFHEGDRVFALESMNGEGIVEGMAGDGTITVQFPIAEEVKYVCSNCEKDPHPKRYPKATSRNLYPKPVFLCQGATRVEKAIYSDTPDRVSFKPTEIAKIESEEQLQLLIRQRNVARGIA